MKDALKGQVHVHDLGNLQLQQRQEDPFGGLTKIAVFHRRLAHNCCGIDGVGLTGDRCDMKDGVVIGQ